jgi:hypothetical protein
MLRYRVTEAELRARVGEQKAGWLETAVLRTGHFKQVRKYDETEGSWSQIKDVYVELQHNKCAYCERKLAHSMYGLIDHDVEHFRPKSRVTKWPPKKRNLKYTFDVGDEWAEGYYELAYNLFNYATACKPCNTVLKGNYFPISGPRGPQSGDIVQLNKTERPFLIYPVGSIDVDPETLITFEGIMPIPVGKGTSVKARRGRVTIDFFDLEGREDLREERAQIIDALFLMLELARTHPDASMRQHAHDSAVDAKHEAAAHASCARAFYALYERDYTRARLVWEAAHAFVRSKRG